MDKLKSMQVFVYVVENGSFRSAANHFEISATMVGKHIHFLESSLGSRLLNRTTRKQSVTETGQLYYQECQRIIDDIKQAENLIQALENTPQGTIKINCPVTFGNEVLAPVVADFLQAYPSINVELTLDNNLIDPYQHNVDVILRIGELIDSTLVARKLGLYQMMFCASPEYLATYSCPKKLDELSNHTCLGFVYSEGQTQQSLKIDTDAFSKFNTRLASNNGQALKTAAVKGIGIILQPRLLVEKEIERGDLIEILPDFVPYPKPVHLVYRNKQLSLKNRTFVDFVIENVRGQF